MVPNFVWGVCLYTGGWGQTLEKMGPICMSYRVWGGQAESQATARRRGGVGAHNLNKLYLYSNLTYKITIDNAYPCVAIYGVTKMSDTTIYSGDYSAKTKEAIKDCMSYLGDNYVNVLNTLVVMIRNNALTSISSLRKNRHLELEHKVMLSIMGIQGFPATIMIDEAFRLYKIEKSANRKGE